MGSQYASGLQKYLRWSFLRKTTRMLPIHVFLTLIRTLDLFFEWKSNIRSWPSKQMQAQS